MNSKSGSGSGLFLMEMIVVVFFFILCASTCILVFVRSNHMSQLAKNINQSVLQSESIAECWKSSKEGAVLTVMNGQKQGQAQYLFYWDQNWGVRHRCFRGFFYCRAVCDRDRRTGKWKNMKLMIPCPYGRGMNDRRGSYEYCRDAE